MSRWQPGAPGRLHDAALELFEHQGFARTTVAEIASRAGLTERSFFNHFVDKRDVLFGAPTAGQRRVVEESIAKAEPLEDPLDVAVAGLQAAATEVLEDLRDSAAKRRSVIDATPELQEREQSKRAAEMQAIAGALSARGVDEATAELTARVSMLIQEAAEREWTRAGQQKSLTQLLSETRAAVSDIAGIPGLPIEVRP